MRSRPEALPCFSLGSAPRHGELRRQHCCQPLPGFHTRVPRVRSGLWALPSYSLSGFFWEVKGEAAITPCLFLKPGSPQFWGETEGFVSLGSFPLPPTLPCPAGWGAIQKLVGLRSGSGRASPSLIPGPGSPRVRSRFGRSCPAAPSTPISETGSRVEELLLTAPHQVDMGALVWRMGGSFAPLSPFFLGSVQEEWEQPLLFPFSASNWALPSLGKELGVLPQWSLCSTPGDKEQSGEGCSLPVSQTPVSGSHIESFPTPLIPGTGRGGEGTAPHAFPRSGSPWSGKGRENRGDRAAAG